MNNCLNEKKNRKNQKKRKEQCERSIKRTFVDQKKEKTIKTTIKKFSNIILFLIIILFSNFWESISIFNEITMKNIEFFSLNFRNVMISANIFATFLFFETDVFNFSMIDTNEMNKILKTDVVVSFKINTIEIKKISNTLFLCFF